MLVLLNNDIMTLDSLCDVYIPPNKSFVYRCYLMRKLIYIFILIPFLVSGQKLKIGAKAYGGVVFYLDKTKKHGLIVSTENVGDFKKYVWGCSGKSIRSAEGIKIGTGLMNTLEIANSCKDALHAAQVCLDYSKGEFDDWYLPSLGELEEIAYNLGKRSKFSERVNFDNCYYYSSTQFKNKKIKGTYAWIVNIYENHSLSGYKSTKHKVRAIRAF